MSHFPLKKATFLPEKSLYRGVKDNEFVLKRSLN